MPMSCLPMYSGNFSIAKQLLTLNQPSTVPQVNSEKRKEKSRDAARCRRSKESDIFADLTRSLPLCATSTSQLDKASVMRLTIAYLKSRAMLQCAGEPELIDENEAPYDFVFPNAIEGFLMALSSEGDIVYVTENVCQHLGFPQVDVMGQSIYDYSHPCDHDELREILSVRTESAENDSRSFFLRLKSTLTTKGRSVNMKSASYKVLNCSGRIARAPVDHENSGANQVPFYAILIAEPVPHPANIEIPLGRFAFLTKHSMDMKYTYVDEKIGEFLGYKIQEMEGKSAYEFHHMLDHEAVIKSYKTLLAKGQCQTPVYRFLARHGGYIWLQTQATLVYGSRDSRPQAVVCVHQILSGIEEDEQVLAVTQDGSVSKKPIKTLPVQTPTSVQSIYQEPPTAMTSKVFVPITSDMNTNAFLSFDIQSGATVLKEEPEDLTHLAPAAGDTCVPLEIPAGFFSFDELLVDEDLPPDVLECFPMTTFDFMDVNRENDELICEMNESSTDVESDLPDAVSATASIFKQDPNMFSLSSDKQDEEAACSRFSPQGADLQSPLFTEELDSPPAASECPNVSRSETMGVEAVSNKMFRTTELSESAGVEDEDYETRAPFIPDGEDHDLPIFDCVDLFNEDLDCFMPAPTSLFSSEEVETVSPTESHFASPQQESESLSPKTKSLCPFYGVQNEEIQSVCHVHGVKRQVPLGQNLVPDEKRFKRLEPDRTYIADSPEGESTEKGLLDVEDSLFNPVQFLTTPMKTMAPPTIQAASKDPPNQMIQHQKPLEPETLRRLLLESSKPAVSRSTSSVLQNLLVSGRDEQAGYKVEVKLGIGLTESNLKSTASATCLALPSPLLSSTSRKVQTNLPQAKRPQLADESNNQMGLLPLKPPSVELASDASIPLLLSPEADFFDQLPLYFGTAD